MKSIEESKLSPHTLPRPARRFLDRLESSTGTVKWTSIQGDKSDVFELKKAIKRAEALGAFAPLAIARDGVQLRRGKR
eukprot:4245545-Prorocentrum_lima.AAC.1